MLTQRIRALHTQAAEDIFFNRNAAVVNNWVVDVHGLHVHEAVAELHNHMAIFARMPSRKVIRFITGKLCLRGTGVVYFYFWGRGVGAGATALLFVARSLSALPFGPSLATLAAAPLLLHVWSSCWRPRPRPPPCCRTSRASSGNQPRAHITIDLRLFPPLPPPPPVPLSVQAGAATAATRRACQRFSTPSPTRRRCWGWRCSAASAHWTLSSRRPTRRRQTARRPRRRRRCLPAPSLAAEPRPGQSCTQDAPHCSSFFPHVALSTWRRWRQTDRTAGLLRVSAGSRQQPTWRRSAHPSVSGRRSLLESAGRGEMQTTDCAFGWLLTDWQREGSSAVPAAAMTSRPSRVEERPT